MQPEFTDQHREADLKQIRDQSSNQHDSWSEQPSE